MAYWKIKTKDNREVSEQDGIVWKNVKDNIQQLMFVTDDNKVIEMPPNMEEYFQAKTASITLGTNDFNIESRFVGFKLGNNMIKLRIDEKTKNIFVEID
jgi:hypothetical protein